MRFISTSAKFGTCTVDSVQYINGTLIEDKMRTVHSSVNVHNLASMCPCGPVYTLDGASAKFNTNSHEMDCAGLWLYI
jgi:hypothetical protein